MINIFLKFLSLFIIFYKTTFKAPLDKHSRPNVPTPEKRSKTQQFSIFISINLECFIRLNIDSLTNLLKVLWIYLKA